MCLLVSTSFSQEVLELLITSIQKVFLSELQLLFMLALKALNLLSIIPVLCRQQLGLQTSWLTQVDRSRSLKV